MLNGFKPRYNTVEVSQKRLFFGLVWFLHFNGTCNYTRMLLAILNKVLAATPPQGTNHTANCLPSRKLYKLDEPDTQDTAGEARTNSLVMYSYGPLHVAKQKQDDQLEHTYSEDTGCSPEDLPEATNDREKWRERVRDIHASGTTWWWWWYQSSWVI